MKPKTYKGEKYIYLLMGYTLAKLNGGRAIIGYDNGKIGGQNYYRKFYVVKYEGKTLLTEYKISKAFAEYSRTFEIWEHKKSIPTILDYINEDGENAGNNWVH